MMLFGMLISGNKNKEQQRKGNAGDADCSFCLVGLSLETSKKGTAKEREHGLFVHLFR